MYIIIINIKENIAQQKVKRNLRCAIRSNTEGLNIVTLKKKYCCINSNSVESIKKVQIRDTYN